MTGAPDQSSGGKRGREMDEITASKIDGLVTSMNAMQVQMAHLEESAKSITSTVDKLHSRLYNGGQGDITKIQGSIVAVLERITSVETVQNRFSSLAWVGGCVGSFSAFTLLVIEIVHGIQTITAVHLH